jgi:hypothetical protein
MKVKKQYFMGGSEDLAGSPLESVPRQRGHNYPGLMSVVPEDRVERRTAI